MPDPGTDRVSPSLAQARADRIRAFRLELAQLELDRVLLLTDEQRERLTRYHQAVLASLVRRFAVDTRPAQRPISWGVRVASFLVAGALSTATVFFAQRFWPALPAWVRVPLLVALPCTATLATWRAARSEGGWEPWAGPAGLAAFAALAFNLWTLAAPFGDALLPVAGLACCALALVIAYGFGLPLLLGPAVFAGCFSFWSCVGVLVGTPWTALASRPECALPLGLGCLLLPALLRQPDEFARVLRSAGLLLVLVPLLVLSNWGSTSWLPGSPGQVQALYLGVGLAASGLATVIGLWAEWSEATHLGTAFLVLFLYLKLVEWWWDRMPSYLFFLAAGLASLLLLVGLRKLRDLGGRAPT